MTASVLRENTCPLIVRSAKVVVRVVTRAMIHASANSAVRVSNWIPRKDAWNAQITLIIISRLNHAASTKGALKTAESALIPRHAPSATIFSTWTTLENASSVALESTFSKHISSAETARRTARHARVMINASPVEILLYWMGVANARPVWKARNLTWLIRNAYRLRYHLQVNLTNKT
jgi:hypothetical protein